MGFLNATLLFGLLASAIPVVVHLLGRREPKRLEFPALRFLTQRIESNRRRLRIRHWALLVLRMIAIAAFALALAQPHIASSAIGTWLSIGLLLLLGICLAGLAAWAFAAEKTRGLYLSLAALAIMLLLGGTLWGMVVALRHDRPVVQTQSPSAVAVVVDNSIRMGYENDQSPRMEDARQWAQWLIDHYPPTSTFVILDRSPRPAIAAIDVSAAKRTIRRLSATQVVQPLESQIQAAATLIAESPLENQILYVITDRTAASWSAEPRIDLPPSVQLKLIDVGSESHWNLALGDPQIASESISKGIPSTVQVPVVAEGDVPAGEITVELALYERDPSLPVQRDGQTIYPELRVMDRQQIGVDRGVRSEVRLSLPPLEPGVHHAQVRMLFSDPLPIDNTRYVTVMVDQPPRALLVADNPNERRVIEQALALPGISGSGSVDFQVDGAAYPQLATMDLTGYNAVGLLDPPPLSDSQQSVLSDWIKQGGKLMVSLGPAWEEVDSNSKLHDLLIGRAVRQWRVPPPGRFIDPRSEGHPALRPFAAVQDAVPWQLYPVSRYWQMQRQDNDLVVAGYSGTPHACLIDRPIGDGRMMLLTTPIPGVDGAGRRWNELFSTSEEYWPAFLLVRGIFDYLTDRDPGTLNVLVGQPVGLEAADNPVTRYQLFNAQTTPVVVESSGSRITPGPPMLAGNYWLRSPAGTIGYSANVRLSDSVMQRIDPDELTGILGGDRYQLITQREQMDWSETTGSAAQPFYAQMMLLVCSIFVLEQLLSNRFYASPTSRRT
ncbi:MAG: BatA domain-containing protein [Pirellulaceae bacterium]